MLIIYIDIVSRTELEKTAAHFQTERESIKISFVVYMGKTKIMLVKIARVYITQICNKPKYFRNTMIQWQIGPIVPAERVLLRKLQAKKAEVPLKGLSTLWCQ